MARIRSLSTSLRTALAVAYEYDMMGECLKDDGWKVVDEDEIVQARGACAGMETRRKVLE